MHTYRTKEFEEDFKEIDKLDEDNQPTEESSDDEDIVEDSESDSRDHENDVPTQEFPIRESESYKTEDKIVYESQVLFSALKEGRELPSTKRKRKNHKKNNDYNKKGQQNTGKTNANKGGNKNLCNNHGMR